MLSEHEPYNHLYQELVAKSKRLDRPPNIAELYVVARVYKFVLYKTGKDEIDTQAEKDYFKF